jgi:hypothetical protein
MSFPGRDWNWPSGVLTRTLSESISTTVPATWPDRMMTTSPDAKVTTSASARNRHLTFAGPHDRNTGFNSPKPITQI